MASRALNTRRTVTRRGNDENAIPAQTAAIRTKTSASQLGLGPPSKSTASQPIKKPTAVKAGVKRTALGGVVTNIKEDEVVDNGKKTGKVKAEPRQPLAVRPANTNGNSRPVAPVPHRAKQTLAPHAESATMESEDDLSEMDVDRRDGGSLLPPKIDEESILGEGDEEDEGESGEEEEEEDDEDWTKLSELETMHAAQELEEIRATFHEEIDVTDTTMESEYSAEIFKTMAYLEETAMPNPRYMEFQTEIEWTMRTTLIDWLLQVHLRYHMLPETLWIAVNIVDRFLSVRVVSLVKLQLVGVTAMFIAAKYEEILAPSVDEFVYMTENGYSKEEILKGERIILQTLDFTVSSYCSPYSWVRRISKADDYDIQTRTLSKFLMEVTLLDHRFLRCKPSMVAAIGMYLARKMLNGDWNEAFVFYSNLTEAQLLSGAVLLCERLVEPDFESVYVYKKYANKKFLRASTFARDWAQNNSPSTW